jgi:hypothetical protein
MHDKNWVELMLRFPDCDIIYKHFLSGQGKKGPTFKAGKTFVQFHVPNEIHATMLKKREADELVEFKNEDADRTRHNVATERVAVDFMVGAHTCPKRILD